MASDSGRRRRTLDRQRETRQDDELVVSVHWEDGPVTDAWTQLWRRIFEDLAADKVGQAPTPDDHDEGQA